jgi:acyl-CoA thioesterase-1
VETGGGIVLCLIYGPKRVVKEAGIKKFIFLTAFFGLILGFCVLTGCNHDVAGNNTESTLVCFGDSLTAGYGATVPRKEDREKSFPAYLQNKINIPVINAGTSGFTTPWALTQVEKDVLSKNPLIVIIELGANDLRMGIDIKNTERKLQNIIDLIKDGKRKIYIAKFYTEAIAREMARVFNITDYDKQTELINQYDTMFNTLASSNNIELIEDIWNGVWGIHMSDQIHPNAAGYEIMADNIFKVLKPYLRENNLLNQGF